MDDAAWHQLVERVRITWPYPVAAQIAHVDRLPRSGLDRLDRLQRAFEMVIRLLTWEQIAEYVATGPTDPKLNSELFTFLFNERKTEGTWVGVLKAVARALRGRDGLLVPEIGSWWWGVDGARSAAASRTVDWYPEQRNDIVHAHKNLAPSEHFALASLARARLAELVTSMPFLERWRLVVPVRVEGEVVLEHHLARGDTLTTSWDSPIRVPGLRDVESPLAILEPRLLEIEAHLVDDPAPVLARAAALRAAWDLEACRRIPLPIFDPLVPVLLHEP